jgi:hypothetical protein
MDRDHGSFPRRRKGRTRAIGGAIQSNDRSGKTPAKPVLTNNRYFYFEMGEARLRTGLERGDRAALRHFHKFLRHFT